MFELLKNKKISQKIIIETMVDLFVDDSLFENLVMTVIALSNSFRLNQSPR